MKMIFYIYGWIFVRPRRWLFNEMHWASVGLNWKIIPNYYYRGNWFSRIKWPNPHWYFLYKTVYTFFRWLSWDAWTPIARWENRKFGRRLFLSKIIKRIGETTARYQVYTECYHCAWPDGNPTELSDQDGKFGGDYFKLEKTWEVFTGEYTDYRFRGITTCPRCGYQQEYEDGSA